MPLVTVGHGTLGREELRDLLVEAGVDVVVDVRRYPGSRRHPHVARSELERWLPAAGIAYRWDPRLGGRRTPAPDSEHVAIRNASFRAYADHMGSQEWQEALAELVADARTGTTAALCSESVWWRCHRRFIADAAALLHGLDVHDLMHDGRCQAHPVTDGARRSGDRIVYDRIGGQPSLLEG